MSLFFFVYTIVILSICVITAIFCIAALAVTHRRRYIPQAGFFISYFVELASIFGEEWLQQNVDVIDASNYYAVDMPAFRIIVGAVILACFWFIVLDLMDIHSWRPVAVSTALIVIAQALILALLPYGPLRQWLFYTMRQVSLIACLLCTLVHYQRDDDPVFRQRMKKRLWIYIVLWVLIAGILAEDAYVILIAPIPSGDSNFAGLYLSSRNISENLMMVFLAAINVRRAWTDLSLRFSAPPESREAEGQQARDLNNHIEDRLPRYAQDHGLSKREAEVLGLAIEGKSNREIANELVLAEGTIKTHLHNIMKKCDVANREELKQSFWAS